MADKLNLINKKVWLAGHRGLVGRAIYKLLKKEKATILTKTSKSLDLRNLVKVRNFIKKNKPDIIIIAAGRVGGILANLNNSIDFYYDNILIGTNIIKSAYDSGIKKLIFLGSSCVYPKSFKNKIRETDLLSGKLEKTNESYAIAKIACAKFCQAINKKPKFNYITLMPCNVYGPYDNFDKLNSHVIAALISRFVDAKIKNKKQISIWGSGKPKREFIHSHDLASAIIYIIKNFPNKDIINIGVGYDISIRELVKKIAFIINYKGKIRYDISKPDGTFRKLLNNKIISDLGWMPNTQLDKGIKSTIDWYKKNYL